MVKTIGVVLALSLVSCAKSNRGRLDFHDDTRPLSVEIPAVKILYLKCYACHGAVGAGSGGFHSILWRSYLIKGWVNLQNPEESAIIRRMADGTMPPKVPLSEGEIQVVIDWIREGLPGDTL